MPNKFSIGDKVRLNKADTRTPKQLLKSVRLDHQRTIGAIFYDPKTEHTRYYLGTNKRGSVDLSFIPFRASQLIGKDDLPSRRTRMANKKRGIANHRSPSTSANTAQQSNAQGSSGKTAGKGEAICLSTLLSSPTL